MFYKKEERPLGNEVKNKKIKKNPKYFQSLEYREIEKKPESTNKVEINNELPILPIGSK